MAVRETLSAWLLIGAALVTVGGLGAASAAPAPPTGPVLESLAKALVAPETQAEAIQALQALPDPAVEPLLRALKDGALYPWQDQLVLLGDDGGLRDVRGRPVVDAGGNPASLPDGQEPIALEEAHFGLIQRALERFELFSPSPETRKSAAARLGGARDPGAGTVLERALAAEARPDVKAVIEAAWARLRLAAPDAATRLAAARSLGRLKSEAALAALRERLADEPDAAVRQAIQDAVRAIESYVGLRSVVGYVFNGVSLGAVLLLMSLGLAVTFGLMGVINMAHGEMLMLGSYTAFVVQELFATRWPAYQDHYFTLALPLSFLAAGLVGLALESTVIRFLYGRPLETLIVTWGVGMIFQQTARLVFGDQTSVNPPAWLRGGVEAMPGLVFPWSRLFIVGLALAALGALWGLLHRSYGGLEARAVMQNRAMAACLGISTRRLDALTFALGTALAGLAGCALALIGTVDPEVGKTYIVDAFMVVVLGGVGKLAGTVVAAFGVGVSNKLLEPFLGGTAAAVYAKVLVLLIVIAFLQWRPTGLVSARGRAAEAA